MVLPGPRKTEAPEKELRFTRSAQAQKFFLLAMACLGGVLAILSLRFDTNAKLSAWWALLPLLPFLTLLWLAWRCLRYAYLLLTPLGVEIFPFWKPSKNFRLVPWGEIAIAEISPDEKQLIIHHNTERTSGIVLSLRPIEKSRRNLLIRALRGRASSKQTQEEAPEAEA